MISFFVPGIPAPQGSKRYLGPGRVVESSKRVAPWRADIRAAAEGLIKADTSRHLWENPVAVTLEFFLPRPKGHYGTGRNPKCDNCMAHCGYEATAVAETMKRAGTDVVVSYLPVGAERATSEPAAARLRRDDPSPPSKDGQSWPRSATSQVRPSVERITDRSPAHPRELDGDDQGNEAYRITRIYEGARWDADAAERDARQQREQHLEQQQAEMAARISTSGALAQIRLVLLQAVAAHVGVRRSARPLLRRE